MLHSPQKSINFVNFHFFSTKKTKKSAQQAANFKWHFWALCRCSALFACLCAVWLHQFLGSLCVWVVACWC